MNLGDVFDVDIRRVLSEVPAKRGVFVTAELSCYADYTDELYFEKEVWRRVKAQKRYNEREAKQADFGRYLESLSDEEYYRRFEHDVEKFTDEELVAEINRRASKPGIFCHIGFEVKAIVKDNRR